MIINMLKSKIHRVTVTNVNLDYEGSIAIDADLMKAADMIEFEQVDVYNIENGERFTTYAIKAPGGSGTISVQGAAAHKASVGDLVIICSYAQIDKEQASEFVPNIVKVDSKNRIKDNGRAAA